MEGDYEEGSGSGPGRRKTIRNLEKSRRKTQAINTLDVAFRQRFFSLSEGAGESPPLDHENSDYHSVSRERSEGFDHHRSSHSLL